MYFMSNGEGKYEMRNFDNMLHKSYMTIQFVRQYVTRFYVHAMWKHGLQLACQFTPG